MNLRLLYSFFCIGVALLLNAGTATASADSLLAQGFQYLPSGLAFKIVSHGTGKHTPKPSDHIEMHIHVHVEDSIIFDSRQMNNSLPVPFQITEPKFQGDPVEGFMLMRAGDSAIFKIPVALMKKSGNQLLPYMKEGKEVTYNVCLVSVLTDKQQKKDQAAKTKKQRKIDKKLLTEYFTKLHINAEHTKSGIYYVMTKPGEGETAAAKQHVTVNYTGKLLNGKVFDSNTDPMFKHKEPYTFELGTGKVIKGWDEGLQLFGKGGKGTLYIPSDLAYGSQDRSPQIPANSILVFDVELLDIQK